MWRMPLWRPYRKMLDSKIADLNNVSESPHAGAVTAALYLQEFVPPDIPWAHLDAFGWNPQARPGLPEGGEATALRLSRTTLRLETRDETGADRGRSRAARSQRRNESLRHCVATGIAALAQLDRRRDPKPRGCRRARGRPLGSGYR
jgi:hypothetical protein